MLEQRMHVLEHTDELSLITLYHLQKQFLTTSFGLLERLQEEARANGVHQLPEMHTVLRRTWSVGVESALQKLYDSVVHAQATPSARLVEAARAEGVAFPEDVSPQCVLFELLECMLCGSYALCACLYETATELRVRRACVEWLGDLACRQLALLQFWHAAQGTRDGARGRSPRRSGDARPDDAPVLLPVVSASNARGKRAALYEEYDAWLAAAYRWYGKATRDTPNEGHLYTALAQLSSADELYALYFFCKSLEVVHPSHDTRALMHAFFAYDAQAYRLRPDASVAELLVYVHGQLATRTHLDAVPHVLERIVGHCSVASHATAYSGTRLPHTLLETEWMMLGLTCIAALFEYGRADAYVDIRLLAAYRTPSHARVFSEANVARAAALLAPDALHAPPALRSGAPAAGCMHAARRANVPHAAALALQLVVELVHIATHLQHEALENPVAHINSPTAFLVLVLSALHILALRAHENPAAATLTSLVRTHLPWHALGEYACANVWERGAPDAAQRARLAQTALPEDWCLCGVAWNTHHPVLFDPIPSAARRPPADTAPGGCASFTFHSETHMFADLGAMARHFASLKTHSYLSAYVQDPELQHLLRVRHARLFLVYAALHEAAQHVTIPAEARCGEHTCP